MTKAHPLHHLHGESLQCFFTGEATPPPPHTVIIQSLRGSIYSVLPPGSWRETQYLRRQKSFERNDGRGDGRVSPRSRAAMAGVNGVRHRTQWLAATTSATRAIRDMARANAGARRGETLFTSPRRHTSTVPLLSSQRGRRSLRAPPSHAAAPTPSGEYGECCRTPYSLDRSCTVGRVR